MKRNKVGFILCATLALVIAAGLFTGTSSANTGSSNVGTRWQLIASPNVGSSDNVLNSVYAPNAQNVWTVGYYLNKYNQAQTLIEHGYLIGKSPDHSTYGWAVVNSPNPGTDNYLNGIAFAPAIPMPSSSALAWAVGYYINTSSGNAYKQALIARYTNSAIGQWVNASPKSTNYNTVLNAVAGSSTNNYIAVGYYYNTALGLDQTLIMYWNGSSWSRVASPSHAGFNSYLTSVSVLDNHTAWAVGYYKDQSKVQRSMLLEWNGTSWKDFSEQLPPYAGNNVMNSVSFNPTDKNAWMVGYDSQKTSPIAYFHDYRGKWVMNNPTVGQLTGVDFISENASWAVGFVATGTNTHNRAYFWDGSNWSENTPISIGTASQALRSVNGVSGTNVWAVGWTIVNGHYVTQIQHYN
jgi:hypothetical protein